MEKKILIIQGSARSDGDTAVAVAALQPLLACDVIDVLNHDIQPYDYEHRHRDDYLPLMRRIVANYDCLIFATPVYWYTMSAQLKTFFDRFTDCLKIDKPTGRQLRGKTMAMLSVSNSDNRSPGFPEPFALSAGYLGMHYAGDVHVWLEGGNLTEESWNRLRRLSEVVQHAH